jgi:hypothetical protein
VAFGFPSVHPGTRFYRKKYVSMPVF